MLSELPQRVATAVYEAGSALVKFLAPNDVGLTSSHQKGVYLPTNAHHIFSSRAPHRGENWTEKVSVEWQDGIHTDSSVKWYGEAKSEFRLTGFNRIRHFHHLAGEQVGSLFLLIPLGQNAFRAFVIGDDDEVEEVCAMLGLDFSERTWTVYNQETAPALLGQNEDDLQKQLMTYVESLEVFPTGLEIFLETEKAAANHLPHIWNGSADERLSAMLALEYRLFRMIEHRLMIQEVQQNFKDIEAFLVTAKTTLQRRVSRAGRSFEYHVESLLKREGIPFDRQPKLDGTSPDIIIPSAAAYYDETYPKDKTFVLAIKTTCKDRWRQVIQEAPRVDRRYLLTTQQGISPAQLNQMKASNVHLIVPESQHNQYAPELRRDLPNVDQFLQSVRATLDQPNC